MAPLHLPRSAAPEISSEPDLRDSRPCSRHGIDNLVHCSAGPVRFAGLTTAGRSGRPSGLDVGFPRTKANGDVERLGLRSDGFSNRFSDMHIAGPLEVRIASNSTAVADMLAARVTLTAPRVRASTPGNLLVWPSRSGRTRLSRAWRGRLPWLYRTLAVYPTCSLVTASADKSASSAVQYSNKPFSLSSHSFS